MQSHTALLWWSLGILNSKRYTALRDAFGTLDAALQALTPSLLKELGLRDATIGEVYAMLKQFDAQKYLEKMHTLKATMITIEDETYPALLREIGDPPVFLSYIGDLSILKNPTLAIVGTRAMSVYGKRLCETFVPAFASAGVVTVSGLARGIDSAVARETMQSGGKTVAVLGHGLSLISPVASLNLAQKIVESGGLIVSEYPIDYAANVYTFPARNRIIAGLSLGTLVIEAPEKSGSIITADLALEYNRDVFAVPGQIYDENAAGCHNLIASGQAKLVTTPMEILQEIGVVAGPEKLMTFNPQSDDERVIHRVLTTMPQTIEEIAIATRFAPARIFSALTMIELAGAAQNLGGGQWVRR